MLIVIVLTGYLGLVSLIACIAGANGKDADHE